MRTAKTCVHRATPVGEASATMTTMTTTKTTTMTLLRTLARCAAHSACWLSLAAAVALASWCALPSSAHAQDEVRPRIVVAVMPSGDVPPGIDRDIQDLFLTALADERDYDLVDREAVYELTELQGDVDLLLCVTRKSCIERMYDEHRFEHYVLVKVTELSQELEFTYVTFSYQNREPIVFGEAYRVDIHDNVGFVNRAFEVAEALELQPLDQLPIGDADCARVTCPKSQRCEAGRCIDREVAALPPEVAPPVEEEPIDWLLIGGISTGVVGLGLSVAAAVLYVDRQSQIDALAASYDGAGAGRISTMDQRAAREQIDSINAEGLAAGIMLGVGLAATAAGAGLLTWALLDDAQTDREPPGQLSLTPGMLPGGGALRATISF